MTLQGYPENLPAGLLADAVEWRRHFHANPELAFNEFQTAEFIVGQLKEWGLEVHKGLGGTGVVGTLRRGTGPRAIGIRADMDALPITEHSDVPYASCKPNIMHACGHDGHIAMALAAARACTGLPNIDGTVHFIFQPAEEGKGGARRMIEDGLFELFPCDSIYALHNWPSLPIGTCIARDGAMMAATGAFEINVSGRGCHAAMPHEGTDCVLTVCQIVCALQGVVSRGIAPLQSAVISATQLFGGEAFNVMPDCCAVSGTTRWLDDRVGNYLESRIVEVANGIAAANGCQAQVTYDRRFPVTSNDAAAATLVRSVASSLPGLRVTDADPSMASEDFAEMLRVVPGCYFWLGSGRAENVCGLHSPSYDFNDEILPIGVALWTSIVRKALAV